MTPRLFFALALVSALPATVQAQAAFKVGYIDTDQVVTRMPEFAAVQAQLGQEQTTVGTRVRFVQDSLNTVLQAQLAEYETFRTSAVATDEARRARETELLQLQGRIEQAQQQGLQYLSYVEARLLQPVLNRVDETIQAEAAAQTIDLVLPTVANNAPVFLYASDRVVNITEAVMRRLGIDPNAPPPAAPGAGAGSGNVPVGGGN